MADDNGDETDGLDEALIPYDAPRRYQKGVYVGEKHLRDDELGSLLDDIRKKTGDKGTVTLALDACHSGTADRDKGDDVYVRGTSYVFAPKDFCPTGSCLYGFYLERNLFATGNGFNDRHSGMYAGTIEL